MDYKIVTDGSCDLPPELCREKGVDVVPFYVSFDSENYMREITDMPIRKFYEQMVADPTTFPKSSMPSVQDYVDVFGAASEHFGGAGSAEGHGGGFGAAYGWYHLAADEFGDLVAEIVVEHFNKVLRIRDE